MRRAFFTLAVGVFVCFVFSISISGQQTTGTSSQALLYLQRSLSQLVGNTSISDVTLTGSVRRIAGSDDETGSIEFQALSSGSSKIQFSTSSGTRTETRSNANSTLAGNWSGPDGVSHPIAFHNLAIDPGLFPLFTLSAIASSQNSMLNLVGQETRDGQSVIHLTASQQYPSLSGDAALLMQHLSQLDIFLDPTTNLPVSLSFKTHPDDNAALDIPIEVRFLDYRTVNRVQVPFHVQKFLNNGLSLDLQFETATLNTGLAPSLFQVQ